MYMERDNVIFWAFFAWNVTLSIFCVYLAVDIMKLKGG